MEAKDLRNPSQEEQLRAGIETENEESKNQELDTDDVEGKGVDESEEKKDADDVQTTGAKPQELETSAKSKAGICEELLKLDFSTLTKGELIATLKELLENGSVNKLRDAVEEIKVQFYKKHKAEIADAIKKFEEAGGVPEDFQFKDDLEDRMKTLLKEFREKKAEYNRQFEHEKEANLKAKYQIVEEIKDLINRKESFNKTFHEFQELQNRWREIGLVPQHALKDLWETYHHHVENFYDYIKINQELRDLDLKKNLAAKVRLCEEAEKLLLEPSVVKAFNTLQKYHEQWREIGPVSRDIKDEIWARFKEATTKINKRHQEHYEGLKSEQRKNLEAKSVLCEKAEEIADRDHGYPKDWSVSSDAIQELQKVWRTIGYAPRKENNRIYQRFRRACDLFFERKRDYYQRLKEEMNNNLQLKTDLCVQAEALQDSTEWKQTTDELIAIQKRWKEIGPVPKKVSEELWVRFRAACDRFFDSKTSHFENRDSAQDENLKKKEELIQRVLDFQLLVDNDKNIEQLRNFQKEWADIGHVPFKHKDRVQEEFRTAINRHFDRLDLDVYHKEVQRFKNKIDGYLEMEYPEDKIITERNKIVAKIKQLESDITIWENNIGFFSNSSSSDSVIQEFQNKIEKGKRVLNLLKEKLAIIDNLV